MFLATPLSWFTSYLLSTSTLFCNYIWSMGTRINIS